MDNINFKGGFLIKKPSTRMWNNIQANLPKHKIVFLNYNDNGDKFFAIKNCYDKEMAEYILKRKIDFKFYPNINLKTRLDPYFPEEAKQIVDSQERILETKKDLRAYIKSLTKPFKIKKYHWKPNDHIKQTLKALDLNEADCIITTKNNITTIRDKNGKTLAIASPNGYKGINYVYECSKDGNNRRLAVSYKGEKEWEYGINNREFFKKLFYRNVKIDKDRIRPQK